MWNSGKLELVFRNYFFKTALIREPVFKPVCHSETLSKPLRGLPGTH
jgi:hypothetical protein